MQPLTHTEWEKHYAQLRQPVLEKFPGVDRRELERIEDDYDGLVALVQRATGLSPESTEQVIRTLDVEELNLGSGAPAGPESTDGARLADSLSLGSGFVESERDRVIDRLRQLDRHLRRFRADATYLELSVKDRETTSQVLTLETEVPGFPRIVAKSKEHDLRAALADVRENTIAQIESAVGKRTEGAR